MDRVEVVDGVVVVARHRRSYARHEQILDPLHYLVTLGRKPAALDHAPVMRANGGAARSALRSCDANSSSVTAAGRVPGWYIRVLQLLAEHPLRRVQQAVEEALKREVVQAEPHQRPSTAPGRDGGAQDEAPSRQEVTIDSQSAVTPISQYQGPAARSGPVRPITRPRRE